MNPRELISSAFEALSLNKTRTALATLGIIIGIAAVITLLSLGQAGQKSVQSSIQSLGSNLLTIIPGAFRPGDFRSASGTATSLTFDDANAIQTSPSIHGVKNVSAELLRRTTISSGQKSTNSQVVGVLPTYQEIRSIELASGEFLTQTDQDSQSKVAILGPNVVSDLYGVDSDPVGQSLRINNIIFKVIGATKSKGGTGFGGNQDDIVIIPLSTAQKRLFNVTYIGSISVEIADPDQMEQARTEIGYLLLTRHKISDPANSDFTILSQADILGAAAQITGAFTSLLSGIAAISLLVGGIGIMNIMLVTVVERTREIGLRKALGATQKIIIWQFLAEAAILTLVGGTLGIILGTLLSFAISKLINLPFILDPLSIILAFGVSGGIGILFGWYPARKAAKLSPIEALRYE